jgi:hypothetical protein
MIENAYYYSNPPDVKQVERKIRPPMHEYMRQLLYKEISKLTVEKVLRQIRKLNWDDPQVLQILYPFRPFKSRFPPRNDLQIPWSLDWSLRHNQPLGADVTSSSPDHVMTPYFTAFAVLHAPRTRHSQEFSHISHYVNLSTTFIY